MNADIEPPPTGHQVTAALLTSGAVGFFLGAVRHPTWQDALEPAQVLAGLVRYPSHNPVYMYATRTWTLLHQVLSVLFRLGFSERTLAVVVSGLLGMLSLQALAMFVLALTRDVALAMAMPLFIYFTNAALGGVTYPVGLMDSPYTYGVVGLSYMLLTVSFLGAGWPRAAALLLGLGPAVHLPLGLWAIALVGLALAIDPRSGGALVARMGPWLLVGIAASAASASIHYVLLQNALPSEGGDSSRYLTAFLQHWDNHRRPFAIISTRMSVVFISGGLSLLWLWRFERDVPDDARVLLRLLVISALIGAVLSLSYGFPPAAVPPLLLQSMPSRVLNLNVVTCMALIVALAWRYRHDVWIQSGVAALVAVLCALRLVSGPKLSFAYGAMNVSTVTLAALAYRHHHAGAGRGHTRWIRVMRRGTVLVPAVMFAATVLFALLSAHASIEPLRDRTNSALLATTGSRPGLLLTAGDLHRIQLRTRRPVLLDGGALDALEYVPDAAPATESILRRVYGVELLAPAGALAQAHVGGLLADTGKVLWETRTAAEWQTIGREFGVTDVLTYPDWVLQLPIVARDDEFILYSLY